MKKTYSAFKQSKWYPLVIGVLAVVLAIICFMHPSVQMESIALLAGIVFLLYGLLQIVNGIRVTDNTKVRVLYFVLGIVVIILAILDFANLPLIGKYLPTLGGFFMIVCAISNLIPSIPAIKNGLKTWWFGAIPSIIFLILGFLFLLEPGFVGQSLGLFVGIALLIKGITSLMRFAQLQK